MLLLATFFPDSDSGQLNGEYDIFLEILKATVDFADLLGLYFALNSVPGKGHAKILTSAIGWASAEVVVTRSVLLWVGARGSEFDWRYVRSCAESNVALLQHAATAALVWLWTRKADRNVTEWDLLIRFYESRKPEQCKNYDLKHPPLLGQAHSHVKQDVNFNLNCTNACFSTSVDLIFKACYTIKSMLLRGSRSSEGHDSFHYVTNNFTNIKTLRNSTPAVKFVNYNDYVSAIWFLGPVPAVNFTMDVCKLNSTLPEEPCEDVTQNCTAQLHEIRCRLRVERGAYSMRLSHQAPWGYGRVAEHGALAEFEHYGLGPLGPEGAEGGWGARWAAAAAAAALALLSAALALAFRARLAARLRRSVLAAWLRACVHLSLRQQLDLTTPGDRISSVFRSEEASAAKAGAEAEAEAGAEEGAAVLLLYARDCAAMEEVARLVGELASLAAPGRVLDLFSGAVQARAAAAPAAWLRALLRRPATRVLLLQTPKAACLYGAALSKHGDRLRLERPLLGGRVVARSPHAGDALLQLALRLMAESAAAPDATDELPYRKYFVAEISGLEAELVPLVTPLRRYALPEAAAALLRDLAPADALAGDQLRRLEPLLQPLGDAVDRLLRYVADHPDYLSEELLFL
ncbi:unnamed protein product, partial [Iphiclides podalirius]